MVGVDEHRQTVSRVATRYGNNRRVSRTRPDPGFHDVGLSEHLLRDSKI